MIISYPFLGNEDDYADETEAQSIVVSNDEYECAHGIYPVSYNQRWHGGCHLSPKSTTEPVRAIADGVIVAYRIASDQVVDENNKKHHNGFVLLKHRTETGEGRSITFYSLYMHLHSLDSELARPLQLGIIEKLRTSSGASASSAVHGGQTKVYRKDILGYPGGMYGNCFIHFEIFMEDKDFTAYFDGPKTRLGIATPTAHADTETDYWGNSYYLIPQGTAMRTTHPRADSHSKIGAFSFPALAGSDSSPSALWVQIRFEAGAKKTTVWNADTGARISKTDDGVSEADYEYGLYKRSLALFPACPSAGYELLRFGRIFGPDTFPPATPASAKENWQPVEFATGESGYVDLSDTKVIKLSDSDFPMAMGWNKVGGAVTDAPSNDGICRIPALQQLIKDADTGPAANGDGQTSPDELVAWVRRDDIRKKLRRMICQAQTEWEKSVNDMRFAPLKAAGGKFAEDDTGYKKFTDFVEKFQFWDQTGGLNSMIWHFHPLEFVAHFKKCGWLSNIEFAQCFPRKLKTLHHATFDTSGLVWGTALSRATAWGRAFNIAARRYGVSSNKQRLVHFFAHVIPETGNLHYVVEIGGEHKLYAPYYGRGLIQLTHRENYDFYGKFGMLSSVPPYSNAHFADIGWDPNALIATNNDGTSNIDNCADSAAFYSIQHEIPVDGKHKNMQALSDGGISQNDIVLTSQTVNGMVSIQNINGLDHRLQAGLINCYVLLDRIRPGDTESMTFVWRRNSSQEPAVDGAGHPIMTGHPPHQKMIFYPTTHVIDVILEMQRPG